MPLLALASRVRSFYLSLYNVSISDLWSQKGSETEAMVKLRCSLLSASGPFWLSPWWRTCAPHWFLLVPKSPSVPVVLGPVQCPASQPSEHSEHRHVMSIHTCSVLDYCTPTSYFVPMFYCAPHAAPWEVRSVGGHHRLCLFSSPPRTSPGLDVRQVRQGPFFQRHDLGQAPLPLVAVSFL